MYNGYVGVWLRPIWFIRNEINGKSKWRFDGYAGTI